jgi:putative transposase
LRLYPNRETAYNLERLNDARRFVWNWALAYCKEQYAATGKTPTRFDLCAKLTALKRLPETRWLSDFPLEALRGSLVDLEQAFKRWWKKLGRAPKFKGRVEPTRFRFAGKGVQIKDGQLYVPKIGWIPCRGRISDAEVSTCAVRLVAGRWQASVQVRERRDVLPESPSVVGIDLGLKSLVTTSDGVKIEAPKFFRNAQRAIKRAAQSVSRKKKGSANREKAKKRLARIHARAAAKREAFLHRVTTDLVREHGTLVIEDLCVKAMAKTRLAKSVLDAAFREFRRQVTYKCSWYGRRLVVADRWFASSRLCSACGAKNEDLTLKDREWTCDGCGTLHDRDFNASMNLKTLAGGCPESLNACGGDVRLGLAEQTSVNQEGIIGQVPN